MCTYNGSGNGSCDNNEKVGCRVSIALTRFPVSMKPNRSKPRRCFLGAVYRSVETPGRSQHRPTSLEHHRCFIPRFRRLFHVVREKKRSEAKNQVARSPDETIAAAITREKYGRCYAFQRLNNSFSRPRNEQ